MSSNFKRAYTLSIGRPESIRSILDTKDFDSLRQDFNSLLSAFSDSAISQTPVDLNFLTIPSEAIDINTLQINTVISLSKDDKGQNQQTTLEIYNLSEEVIEFISKKNSVLILRAGYETDQDLPIIFSGQVKEVSTMRMNTDLVTTITASDGFIPSTGVKVALSLKRPPESILTYKDVFDALVFIWGASGVAISDANLVYEATPRPFSGNPNEIDIPDGWSYEGYLSDAMDDLCDHFRYTWYIHNNTLFIHPLNGFEFLTVFELNPNQIKDMRRVTKSDNGATDVESSGFSINTPLNGNIKMGNLIRVTSGRFEGDYTVKGITHRLNFRHSDWDTIIETEVR
jgi:hypothetical protein